MVKNIYFRYVDGDNFNRIDKEAPLGIMVEERHITPGITFRSPISFTDSHIRGLNIGAFFETAFSTFEVTKQKISNSSGLSEQDLGTEVHGQALDLVYILYIQYHDTYFVTDKKHAIRFGLGGGMGYYTAKGNIYLTENTQEWQKINIDFNDKHAILKGMIEYQFGEFLLSIKDRGLVHFFTGYKSTLRERTIEAAYVYEF